MSEDTNTKSAANAPTQEDVVDLTLNDLSALKSIVDVASSRGAFKPAEMVAVGSVYTKLEKFLDIATKQSQASQAAQAAQPQPTQANTNA